MSKFSMVDLQQKPSVLFEPFNSKKIVIEFLHCIFNIHLKFYNIYMLHTTILSNYYTKYTNTTGTGPQGAKDSDYLLAINIILARIFKYLKHLLYIFLMF